MAFLSKVGSVLRQTASRQFNSELGFTPSIFQWIRCMSSSPSSKLFVGGLSYSTDEPSLRQEFAKYGEIVDARIILDRDTGRSRGFGFVTFTNVEEASSAIQALDGKELHGRLVRINYANDRPRTFGGGYNNPQYGGGSGFGGGYGNVPYSGPGGVSGSGFGGGYGNAPYGGAGGGGSYGDGGAYSSGGGGGYNPGSNYGGPAAGGDYASGGAANYDGGNRYGVEGTGGSYGGSGAAFGNDGSFGVAGGAGGSANLGDASVSGANFANAGYDGSTGMGYDASGAGAGKNIAAGGYDGDNALGYGNSQFGSNVDHAGNDADSLEGAHGEDEDEKGDFANRA